MSHKLLEQEAEKMYKLCLERKMKPVDIDFYIDYKIYKLSHKELAEKYMIAYQTSINKIYNLNKKYKLGTF